MKLEKIHPRSVDESNRKMDKKKIRQRSANEYNKSVNDRDNYNLENRPVGADIDNECSCLEGQETNEKEIDNKRHNGGNQDTTKNGTKESKRNKRNRSLFSFTTPKNMENANNEWDDRTLKHNQDRINKLEA